MPNETVVNVQSRTWPGMNKEGGVGRITASNTDGTCNVAYILGTKKESNVDAVFIEKVDQGGYSSEIPSGTVRRSKQRTNGDNEAVLPEKLLRSLVNEGFDIVLAIQHKQHNNTLPL